MEPTVDESRYGLEGAGASDKGGYVKRAFVPSSSMKRRPLVKHDATIVAVEFFPSICSEPSKYW